MFQRGFQPWAPMFEKILWWKTSVVPLKRKVGNTPPNHWTCPIFVGDLLLWLLVWLEKKNNNNNRSDEFCCTLCQLADITVFLVGFSFYRGVRGVPPLDREKTICEFPSQPGDTHSIAPLLIVWMTKELRRFIAISRVKPSLLTMLFGTPRGQWLSCEMMINQEWSHHNQEKSPAAWSQEFTDVEHVDLWPDQLSEV